jgi:hypothetical protein
MMDLQPAVYEHAARFLGKSPFQVSRDPSLLAAAHVAAWEAYGHTPLVCGMDLYSVEPEAWGARVPDPGGNGVPVVSPHPYSEIEELFSLRPLDPTRDGRLPMILEAAHALKKRLPQVDLRIPISGPFSICANLLGFENLLLGMAEDAPRVREALLHVVSCQLPWAEAAVRHGFGVTLFESAAAPPLLSPDQFRQSDAPALSALVSGITRLTGRAPGLILGGDVHSLVDDLVGTGAGFLICPAETRQAAFIDHAKRHPDVRIRINLDARVVASGSEAEVAAALRAAMGLALEHGNAAIGTGVLAYDLDPARFGMIQGVFSRIR